MSIDNLSQWVTSIYELKTDDPVLGGTEGVSNVQARQLSNRTVWLRSELESLEQAFDELGTEFQQLETDLSDTRTEVQNLRDETQGFRDDSFQSRDKAEQWAEEERNIEVEPGQFSAKHHKLETKDLRDETEQFRNTTEQHKNDAQTARDDAEQALFDFNARYYGPLDNDPTEDLNGDPPTVGDWYYNKPNNEVRIYTTDETWSLFTSPIQATLASQQEAIDGVETENYMSPERSTQHFDARRQGVIDEAVSDAGTYTDGEINTLDTELRGYTDTQVSSHETSTGDVHGVPAGEEVEWKSSAQSKADSAESSAISHADSILDDHKSSGDHDDRYPLRVDTSQQGTQYHGYEFGSAGTNTPQIIKIGLVSGGSEALRGKISGSRSTASSATNSIIIDVTYGDQPQFDAIILGGLSGTRRLVTFNHGGDSWYGIEISMGGLSVYPSNWYFDGYSIGDFHLESVALENVTDVTPYTDSTYTEIPALNTNNLTVDGENVSTRNYADTQASNAESNANSYTDTQLSDHETNGNHDQVIVNTTDDGTNDLQVGGDASLRGNTGFGNTDPSHRVDVNGDVRVRNENSAKFGGDGASDEQFAIQYNSNTKSLDFNFVGG